MKFATFYYKNWNRPNFGDLVSELGIFILAVTFLCFELDKNFIKEKMCGTNNFYSKFFLFFWNFDVWARYGQKTRFGVPVLDCPYLWSGACTKSENRITGVFLSKFFAARKEKLKNGRFRAKKHISRFWFFGKISPKNKNFQKSWNFYYKNYFLHTFCPL